jgi:hypothetical protein
VSRPRTIVLLSVLAVFGAAALSAVVPGAGDYDHDAAAPLDQLARGHVGAFLADQPLMGLVSLLLRAPAVAPPARCSPARSSASPSRRSNGRSSPPSPSSSPLRRRRACA